MKKVIAWLLVLALTAAVSIGATLAYLTDTDEDVNVMTLGKVKIDQLEYERVDDETKDEDATVQEFHDNKPLMPGVYKDGFDFGTDDNYVNWNQIKKDGYTSGIWNPDEINNEVDKMVFVKNKGDYDAYVRSVFAFEAGNYKTLEEFKKMVHLNLNEKDYTWEWSETPVTIGESTYFVATATYNKVLAPGALTEISLSQIALDKTATNADVEAFGETYQVLVKSQGIQADGFTDAKTALDEGFGEILKNIGTEDEPKFEVIPNDFPFENDTPTKGTDLYTALRYLDGDDTGTQITANVTSVTFGLNSEYPQIVDNYDGTLVDVEQDVPVYAYYVREGSVLNRAASNYDVYFLADDVIYSPKYSTSLYQGMSALTTVDTSNYDVSRVERMNKMFRECGKLTTLDTTDWDTSNVTDMAQAFYKCGSLQTITGIESWDTGAVTNMKAMFSQSGVKGDLDLTGWDVSNVTNMAQMFYKCPNLANLDADGWDTGACTDMSYMFGISPSLKTVEAAGWDTSEVTNMYAMFGMCDKLVSLDATGWTNSKVVDTRNMFMNDVALTTLTGSGGWNFASATQMEAMFQDCESLTELDATNWDLSKAETMWNLFVDCENLVTLKGEENWKLSSATTTNFMFQDCGKLKELDVRNWGMNNVTTMTSMFQNCYALEYLNPSQWNTGNCQDFNSMFSYCYNLQFDENTFANWDMSSAVKINHMFYSCGSVEKLNLSGWNMPNMTTTSHMFADCTSLKSVDLSGWNTPSVISLDCMFNHCTSLTSLDVSSLDTSNCKEFSQLFEYCSSLEAIYGLENWDTSNARTFESTFSGCSALTELNLTTFNTRNVLNNHRMDWQPNNEPNIGYGCLYMFSGMTSLEKLVLSADFSFDGDGKVTTESYKVSLPAPNNAEGTWYDADGNAYLPSKIPEEKAATYYAVNPVNSVNP